jgi:predicted nucleic acid-binding protein
VKPPSPCVLDTSVASDLQAARLWSAIGSLVRTFMVPEPVAVTEFRDADLREAKSVGVLIEPLTPEEQVAAAALTMIYRRPSLNDLTALALAKSRGAELLTGDGPLREAAVTETVEVHGVLWLLDALVDQAVIERADAAAALEAMLTDGSRLPDDECRRRLQSWR